MNDNFNIHDWQMKRNIEEYIQTLKPTATPVSESDIASLWDSMSTRVNLRADIIAAAAPTANVNNKALGWSDIQAELQGLVVGYFNSNPREYYYYKGYMESR